MDFKKEHIQSGINKIYNNILDLIFPIECLGCGEENIWLCKKCFRNIKLNSDQYCLHCKTTNELGKFCENCSKKYALDGVWIAGDYENKVLANLIKNLKQLRRDKKNNSADLLFDILGMYTF